jgi:S-adenosylmethionine hydrolase
MPVITLTTDFGLNDPYVGLMKGVIASLAPEARVIDITHGIDAQDIVQAAHAIRSSYAYFPGGSIHLVVVDPGVGSRRAIIALACDGHCFIAPDNGVLSLILRDRGKGAKVYRMDDGRYYRHPVSATFHGRDIFAPLGAHRANGRGLAEMGTPMDVAEMVPLDLSVGGTAADGSLTGTIIAIDRFGNLVTDVTRERLVEAGLGRAAGNLRVTIGAHTLRGLADHYQSVGPGRPLVLIGSRETLEISINGGSAQHHFKATKGSAIGIFFSD